ncbi:MAG: protein kinase [Kiritimatiellae bacterium]|nr:protein kinase [Kiritimatiellia bacterium]
MQPTGTCEGCGAALAGGAVRGLCAKCLLRAGLERTRALTGAAPETTGAPPPRESPPLPPGAELGPYRIAGLLGRGGMGSVYEAVRGDTGRRVALKVLAEPLGSEEARARFLREGRLMASVNHPNSVYVFATEEIDGIAVIVMELVPGGSLSRRVRSRGPMNSAEAVDSALQVIAGLEAAEARGVLHRDIKPSNCFLDADGTVKVGDYGLSIVPGSTADSRITMPGAFVGTPAYSSPEQLRGERLDVRSDVYGVGATLYFLLTGKDPFDGDNVVNMVAAALEKMPLSPREIRPEIPKGLSDLVMRCLSKERGGRPGSYRELRDALAPYDSTAATPASLARRVCAYLIDSALLAMVLLLALLLGAFFSSEAQSLVQGALPFVYFWLAEGLFGASLGKRLMGICVRGPERGAPGLRRAAMRVGVLVLLPIAARMTANLLAGGTASDQALAVVTWAVYLLLFATMRRRNGWAGLHDLLSGTRVIDRPAIERRGGAAAAEPPQTEEILGEPIGPYRVVRELSRTNAEVVTLGYDERLRRRVWIRRALTPAHALPEPIRKISRARRVRWLNGQADWDAFEAPAGHPLLRLATKPLPWSRVRFWLADLAGELAAGMRDGSLPRKLGLDRVWITDRGDAVLLDFPCPGLPVEATANPAKIGSVQRFLNQVALAALEGKVVQPEQAATRRVGKPMPLDAHEFLATMARGGFQTVETLLGNLQPLLRKPATVSRRRRAVSVAAYPFILVFTLLLVAVLSFTFNGKTVKNLGDLSACLAARERMAAGQAAEDSGLSRAFDVYLAGRFGDMLRRRRVGVVPMAFTFAGQSEDWIQAVLRAHPKVDPDQLRAAAKRVEPLIAESRPDWSIGLSYLNSRWIPVMCATAIPHLMLAASAWLNVGAALFFGQNLGLFLLGIAIVNRAGAPASRPRACCRALLVWLPLWIGWFCSMAAWLSPRESGVGACIQLVWPVAILAVLGWAVWRPERSLADRLAGTWLVPAGARAGACRGPAAKRYSLYGVLIGCLMILAALASYPQLNVALDATDPQPHGARVVDSVKTLLALSLIGWGIILLFGSMVARKRARNEGFSNSREEGGR